MRAARPIQARLIACGIVVAATAMASLAAAHAEDEGTPSDDGNRGVRIIAAPTPAPQDSTPAAPPPPPVAAPPPAAAPPPPATPPAAAAITPTLRPDVPAPSALTPAPPPVAPPAASTAPTPRPDVPKSSPLTPPGENPPPAGGVAALPPTTPSPPATATAAEIERLSNSVKVVNPAELAVEILPGPEIEQGANVSFRITTKKPGYLILIDVDPSGKLTQIYPNRMSLLASAERDSANLIKPGKPMQLPNPTDRLANFEFVATPPTGTAMLVAVLSDIPVQMLDLADVPPMLIGSTSAAEHLTKLASELRIPDPKANGSFLEPHWSFDARFYAIR